MKLARCLLLSALLALPACGSDSPSAPNNPPPQNPAQLTVTAAFSNPSANTNDLGQSGPPRVLYEGIVDLTIANANGSSTATVNGTVTGLFTDNSRTAAQTLDPTIVPGGQSATIRWTFDPEVPIANPKTLSGVDVSLSWNDGLGTAGSVDQAFPAIPDWGVKPPGGCVSDTTTACFGGRFQATVDWKANANDALAAAPVDLNFVPGGAVFTFNAQPGQGNDVLVQLLNGCNDNDHYWVFASSLTNVEMTLTVVDTQANVQRRYFNPLGQPANAITDTQAFATCP